MAKLREDPTTALFKRIYQDDIFEKKYDNEIIGKKLKELFEIAKKYNVNYLERVSHKRREKK